MGDSGSKHGYSGDSLADTFVAAGYIALAFLTIHYLVAYKPKRDAVDSVVLRLPHWCFRKLRTSLPGSRPADKGSSGLGLASSLDGWLRMCLVNLADIQAILGFKLLHELYEAVNAEISAAQWQFVMHLAWFPIIACMCSISVLSPPSFSTTKGRTDSQNSLYEWTRLCRAVVLAALLGTMLVGLAPTLFFNWEYGRQEATAAGPGTDARRFLFDFAGELARFRDGHDDGKGSGAAGSRPPRNLSDTHGFQLAVFSVVALMSAGILILKKAIAAAPHKGEKQCARQNKSSGAPINRWLGARRRGIHLEDLDDIESSLGIADVRPMSRSVGGILSDSAVFLVTFNMDLLTSRFAEFWGVARLYGSIPKSEGQIPNGQALWSFSQQLPWAFLVLPFIVATNSYLLRDTSFSSTPSSKDQCIVQNVDRDEDEDEDEVTSLSMLSPSPFSRPPST
ncbi:hypothetical protein PG994_013872 [Apiospora phragmitis]|uniref:Uncharacterized protein n=1 Tax=Apiospora phragmitis TaxID=2905665 RepID=A0ABR1T4H6_9PEZI